MEHIFTQTGHNQGNTNIDFTIEIKANVETDEQKKLVNTLGEIVTSNLCLKDTKLLNTCLNLLHAYSVELLSNLADYTSVNDVELDSDIQNKLDEFSTINNFKL